MVDFSRLDRFNLGAEETFDDKAAELMEQARKFEEEGNQAKAADAWRKAVRAAGDAITPRLGQAKALYAMERYSQAADALGDIVKRLPDDMNEAKVELLKLMAELYDQQGLEPKKLDAYKKAFAIDPTDEELFEELRDLYEKMKRWPDLAKTYLQRIEVCENDGEKLQLLLELAEIYEDKQHNKNEAAKTYEKILEIDPANATAIEHLKELYEQKRDYEGLIRLYKAQVENESDPQARLEKLLEMAHLASERVKKPAILQEAWEAVLAEDPENAEALEALFPIYEKAKDWEKVAEVGLKLMEKESDPRKLSQIATKLAPVLQDKLDRKEDALEVWKRLVEAEPNNRRAQDSLKKLYVELGRWRELEEFFRDIDRLEEFIRILEKEGEKVEDEELRRELMFKEAVLWREELGKADRAVKAYEKILAAYPDDLTAAEALIELYEELNQIKKLPGVLEIRLKHMEDPEERRQAMVELAQLELEKLRNKEAAFKWFLEAVALEPSDEDVRTKAEELAKSVKGGWERLVEVYSKAAEESDGDVKLSLLTTVAQVYREHLGEDDKALEAAREILEIDEANDVALSICEAIYESRSEWEELIKILLKRAEIAVDDEERKEAYARIGSIYAELLEKPEEAVEHYLKAHELDPTDVGILRKLDELYLKLEKWEELLEILEKELELAEKDSERVELKFRWAEIHRQHTGDIDAAIAGYRDVLEMEPSHEGAKAALEGFLSHEDEEVRRRVADILEPIYTQLGDIDALIHDYEVKVQTSEDPAEKLSLLLKIGRIWLESADDVDKAFDAYARALMVMPESDDAYDRLEMIAEDEDLWERLVRVYEKVLEDEGLDDELKKKFHKRAGQVYQAYLEDNEKAIAHYRGVLELDASDVEVLESLEGLYEAAERWEELLETLRMHLEVVYDVDEKRDLRFRAADILENRLDRPADALGFYEDVLTDDPQDLEALRALDRLYTKLERWSELADNLTKQLELVDDVDEKLTLYKRLGLIQYDKLEEYSLAIDSWQKGLEINNEDTELISYLERFLDNEEHRVTVAKILEPVYTSFGWWEKLVRIYEIMFESVYDPGEQISYLHRIAELYREQGGDPDKALATFARAFDINPTDEATRQAMEELASDADKWEDLLAIYAKKVEQVRDEETELAIELQMHIGELLATEVGDIERAARAYERVLEIKPDHVPALDRLENLFLESGDTKRLVETLLRKVEVVYDQEEKLKLAYRAAELQLKELEDVEGAVSTYYYILENIDDTQMEALDALEDIFAQREDWGRLKDVYARKADLFPTLDEKKRMLYVLGQLYDENLKNLDKAIETYESILDEDPNDEVALQRLESLYERAGKWAELQGVLESELALVDNDQERVVLMHKLGEVLELHLDDTERAVSLYSEALSLVPDYEDLINALYRVMRGGEGEEPDEERYPAQVRLAAAQVLERHFERMAEYQRLPEILEAAVANLEDDIERIEYLHKLAEVWAVQLEDVDKALDALARALRMEPRNEKTLSELERLVDVSEKWEWLVELYGSLQLEDDDDKIFFALRRATILDEKLAKPDSAIEAAREVLTIDEDNREALALLDKLCFTTSRWEELIDVLQKEIEISAGDEALEHRIRLAQVLETQLGKSEEAVEHYRAVVEEDPSNERARRALIHLLGEGVRAAEIFEVLEPILRDGEEWEALVELIEKAVQHIDDPAVKLEHFKNEAEIKETKLYDPDSALDTLLKGVALDPEDEDLHDRIERLAGQLARWDDVVAAYKDEAEAIERYMSGGQAPEEELETLREQAKGLWMRVARLGEEKLMDVDTTEEAYLRILNLEPSNEDALAALDRIYQQNMMFPELAGILAKRAEYAEDSYDKVQFLFRLAALKEEQLDDIDGAIEALEKVVQVEEDNEQAWEELERLRFEQRNWPELYRVYERWAAVMTSDDDKAEAYSRMAKIAYEALKDAEKSKELWNKVLQLRDDDTRALQELAEIARDEQEWEKAFEYLNRLTDVTFEPEEQVKAYLLMGDISLNYLKDYHKALDAYLQVRSIQEDNLEALKALAHIYRESQAWEELVEVLGDLGRFGEGRLPDRELRDIYAELGKIQEELLVDIPAAIEAWERVLEFAPEDMDALVALERLLTQEERWEDTIRILHQRVKVERERAKKVEILFQIAEIWSEKIGNELAAAKAYRAILKVDPRNEKAYEELVRIYSEHEEWDTLIEVLMERFETLGGNEEEPPRENIPVLVETLLKVAEITEEKLNSIEDAFDVLEVAFGLDPANPKVGQMLERLAQIGELWERLIELFLAAVEELEDRRIKSELLVMIGRWYAEHLDSLEDAQTALEEALRLNPDSGSAYLVMADLHKREERWGEYVSALEKALELEKRPEIAYKAACELANVYEKQFGDELQAIRYYQMAHQLYPEGPEAVESLERLYERNSRWRDLIALLEEQLTHVKDDEEAIEIKTKIADIHEFKREAPSRAIEVYLDILEKHPDHIPTMRSLERLYEKIGDMDEYLALLQRELELLTNPEERIMKLHQMAAVWEEHFEKVDKAIEAYEAILEISDRDEEAYLNLARLYRQEKNWLAYIDVLYRHINVIHEPAERVRLYKEAAEILENKLGEVERAIDAYHAILEEDPNDQDALAALSRLYEAREDWDSCYDYTERLLDLTDDDKLKVQLFYRLGRIREEKFGDMDEAERLYAEAVGLDPSYVPALRALANIYKERGDWLKAARMLEAAQEYTSNMVEKVEYLAEAGAIYLDHLDDSEHAKELLQKALEIDPEHVESAAKLVDVLWQEEDWEGMYPHLKMLIRKASSLGWDKERLLQLYVRYGTAAEKVGEYETALKAFHEAYRIERTSLDVLMGMASALFHLQRWDEAFKVYKQILVHPMVEEQVELHAEIYHRLGSIKFAQGDRRKALNLYEKALEAYPGHRETLEKMIELYMEEGNYKAAAEVRERLAEQIDDPDERFEYYRDLADFYRRKVEDPHKAIEMLDRALELHPDDRLSRLDLVELYEATQQWKKMVRVLEEIAEQEQDPKIRAKYYWYTIARIYMNKIKSLDEAVEYFNRALDDDPMLLEAFQNIDAILTKRKDWKMQERNYRRMLKRLMKLDPDLQDPEVKKYLVALWHALGEVYRSRLKDIVAAIEAFETASKLEPENMMRHEILAELYIFGGPNYYEKAIAKHQELLDIYVQELEATKAYESKPPLKIDILETLYDLYYNKTKQYDKAWCVAGVLTMLQQATPEIVEFYEQYRPQGLVRFAHPITQDLWEQAIISKEEHAYLRVLYGALAWPIATARAVPLSQLGLRRDMREVLTANSPLFTRRYFEVAQMLGMPNSSELYLAPQWRGEMQLYMASDAGQVFPVHLVGQLLLEGRTDRELAFIIAREFAYLRPEHMLIKMFTSPAELKALLLGAIRLINPTLPLQGDENAIRQTAEQIRQILPPQSLQTVQAVIGKILSTGRNPSVSKFVRDVEATAHRAGLTITHDLETALMIIRNEPVIAGGRAIPLKVAKLLRFAVSEEYFRLRRETGVAIG